MCDLETSRMGAPYIYIYDISRLRVNYFTKEVEISSLIVHRVSVHFLVLVYRCDNGPHSRPKLVAK